MILNIANDGKLTPVGVSNNLMVYDSCDQNVLGEAFHNNNEISYR